MQLQHFLFLLVDGVRVFAGDWSRLILDLSVILLRFLGVVTTLGSSICALVYLIIIIIVIINAQNLAILGKQPAPHLVIVGREWNILFGKYDVLSRSS